MRKFTWLFALAIPVTIISCQKEAVSELATEEGALVQGQQATGNGAPSGSHYTLNIIGVSNPKTTDMTGTSGHTIFVNLSGKTKINLANADLTDGTFSVLDRNGTDANGATFQLPSADLDNDGVTTYSVWARPLGKPGGAVKVTTCATDPTLVDDPSTPTIDETQVCSIGSYVTVRESGGQKFEDVSKYLLYIYADLANDNVDGVVRIPIFDERLQGYYWDYDNNGLKVLQLRFYPVASGDIPDPADFR